jgi:hypothetical protein
VPEKPTADEAPARLVQAIRDIVGTPGTVQPPIKHSVWDALFLLLLTANLAFVIFLVPKEWIEGPHWDLLKEAMPVVGGGLFVLVASWYKDWTVRMCQSKVFRVSQIALSIVFSFSLWVRWLPVRPQIDPSDGAKIFVDDRNKEYASGQLIPLSLKSHFFRVQWENDEGKAYKPFKREMTWRQTLLAAFGGEQPHWAHSYKVEFSCVWPQGKRTAAEQTKGIGVRIVPIHWPLFDRGFLKSEAAEHSLQTDPSGSLIFHLPETDEPFGATRLPMGDYTVTPFKSGCKEGPSQPLYLKADLESPVEFEALKCD